MEQKFIKIGHRGAAGYEPENTLLSFKKALELGVDMIELDIHLSKTGDLVVRHEYFVDGTKNGRSFVNEETLAELGKLDMGKGEKIPTLHEVFDLINRKAKINVEIKDRGNVVKPVLDLIKEYVEKKGWEDDDFLISSFYYDKLREIRKLDGDIKIGVLTVNPPENILDFAKEIQAYSINVARNYLTKEFIEKTHKEGFKIYVFWVPGAVEDIEDVKKMNVDYICSNYPDRLK